MKYLPGPRVQAWVDAHPILAAVLAISLLVGLIWVLWFWIRLKGNSETYHDGH